jgi:hypothetical protein
VSIVLSRTIGGQFSGSAANTTASSNIRAVSPCPGSTIACRRCDQCCRYLFLACRKGYKVGRFSSRFRFVGWLVFFAAGKRQRQAGAKADSGRGETEKIAFGLEERLHRDIIDISPAEREARQFWKAKGEGQTASLTRELAVSLPRSNSPGWQPGGRHPTGKIIRRIPLRSGRRCNLCCAPPLEIFG